MARAAASDQVAVVVMVRVKVATLEVARVAKAAAVQAAVVAALITIKSSVARMSLRRPAYLKNQSRLTRSQLARIKLRERSCFAQYSHRAARSQTSILFRVCLMA